VLGPDAHEREFAELPTLPKAVLMEELDRVVTDPRLRRSRLEAFLDEADAGRLYGDEFRIFSTSGTSGASGLFVYSQAEFAHWAAVFLRSLVRVGVTAETRLVGIGAPSALHLSRQVSAALMAGRPGAAPRLSVTSPLNEVVAALNDYQPEAFVSYPTILALLAEEQLEGRLEIAPRLVVSVSEVLTEDAARRIETAWLKPVDMYASTEVGLIAVGSLDDVGLHVCEEAIVEVVDDRGDPVPPGVPGHRVLLTNLVNRAQPLIRYELTDSVVLADGPDPSGRPYDRIAHVDGRSDDMLRLPSDHGREVVVHPFRLRSPFARRFDVLQYQVVRRWDELLVRIVPQPGVSSDVPEAVAFDMRAALADAGVDVTALPIRAEVVETIEREPGPAAKVKLVVSEVERA
jgi:phenylacetate-CoA ligase